MACRHHIMEITLEKVFSKCLPTPSKGLKITLFQKFQTAFDSFDRSNFKTLMSDSRLKHLIDPYKNEIVEFCYHQLKNTRQPRGDYKELLELSLIILGESPPRGIKILRPGALHRARWMCRLIYCLKIYLFRHKFKMTNAELKGIGRVVVFGLVVYLKAWFTAPNTISAPHNDIKYIKRICAFATIDE